MLIVSDSSLSADIDSVIMLLSVVLLSLLVCSSQAVHYYGTVMTYYPKEITANGALLVNTRYKLSFVSCTDNDTWSCAGNCGTQTAGIELNVVDESVGEWCQREGIVNRLVSGTSPFQLVLAGGNWITGIINSIVSWRAVTDVELSFRSDTNQINTSPVTTILPALRVPSNCPRNISLLAFDPDEDEVKCRNGITSDSECNPCTPPSVFNISPSCTLSFNATTSSNEGPYAVQLVMEDFPRQNIALFQLNGSSVQQNTNEAISKIPIQFVLKVDAAVPSCAEGFYLPRFLPPTPDHGAQILTTVGQTVEINIRAEATQSTISGLLFSGPHNMVKSSQGSGNFTLTWTPSNFENGESHPTCFVVQSSLSSSVYQSDLRCIIVKVGNYSTPSRQTVTPTTTVVSPTTIFLPTTTTAAPTTTTAAPTTTTAEATTTTAEATTTTAAPLTTTAAPTTTTAAPTTTTAEATTTTVVFPTVTPLLPPTATTAEATTTTAEATTTTAEATTTTAAPLTTTAAPTTTTAAPLTTTAAPTTTTAAPPTTTAAPTTTTVVFPTVTPLLPPTATTAEATTTTAEATTTTAAPTTTTAAPTTTRVTLLPTIVTNTTNEGSYYVIALNAKISTTLSLEDDYDTIVQQIKKALTDRGVPSNIIIRIQRNGGLEITTASP